ncbi:helix-turn-helix domain-containing protein [Methanomassiliicoccaceae archaeon COG_1]|nr:helix-turn-helix domain-containing protein [Methanomassiliicoccaceae archaeon COG_1]
MYACKILLDRSKNVEENPCRGILPMEVGNKGIGVEVLTCSMKGEGAGQSMIKITDENDDVSVGYTVTGDGECNIVRSKEGVYVATVVNRRCLLSNLISRANCSLSAAVSRSETLTEWTLIGPTENAVFELLQSMRQHGYHIKLLFIRKSSPKVVLTRKQEHYFNTAMGLGYYDIPKRTGLDGLCRVLGCSKSSLNVVLREAERKIFLCYYDIGSMNRLEE